MSAAAQDSSSQAVEVINPGGSGAVVIVCEHASNRIPEQYRNLGISGSALTSHAAWDPGAVAVARHLSVALDAPLVAGKMSRLVYDCNRPPDAVSAIPAQSERITVPGNRDLSVADQEARVASVYVPFHTAVEQCIAGQGGTAKRLAVITIHSFTPIFDGVVRTVEFGILHDNDTRLADEILNRSGTLPHRIIRRNEPYGPTDGVTHTLQRHAIPDGLPNVMIEVRNDLLRDAAAQEKMTDELLSLLVPALDRCGIAFEGDADA